MMQLTKCQENALDAFSKFLLSEDNEFVLYGSAGCGKSFTTKEFIKHAIANKQMINLIEQGGNELEIIPTATTHKAAKVLTEFLDMPATTIHKVLGVRVNKDYMTGNTYITKTKKYQIMKDTLLIIDEASKICNKLLKMIRESTIRCKVLYIGDKYQLAPVKSTEIPVFASVKHQAELKEVVRYKGGTLSLATKLREGVKNKVIYPITYSDSVIYLSGDEFKERVMNEFKTPNNSKIICWTNAKVNAYNKFIREIVQGLPSEFTEGELVASNKTIIDKNTTLMHTEEEAIITKSVPSMREDIKGHIYTLDNSIEVFQADSYEEVKGLLKHYAKEKCWVKYYSIEESFADLRPNYAITCDKAQGSTYDNVYIDLNDMGKCHDVDRLARMLYVAVTRAKGKVYFYGELPNK